MEYREQDVEINESRLHMSIYMIYSGISKGARHGYITLYVLEGKVFGNFAFKGKQESVWTISVLIHMHSLVSTRTG